MKDELLTKLKEDIEVALVYSTALKAKIKGIYESIASHEEVRSFNEGLKKKVRNVEKIVKSSATFKMMKEYCLVDDGE